MILKVESGSAYPGKSANYHSPSGKLYVSKYRMVYLKQKPSAGFSSFTFPICKIKSIKLLKPWMGGYRYLEGKIEQVQNGGLMGEALFKIFNAGKKRKGVLT
eukprot:UN18961